MADMIHDAEGNLVRLDALVGVLSNGERLIGAFDKGPWKVGGIALKGTCYEMDAENPYGNFRLVRCVPAGGERGAEAVMPLSRPSFTLGKIGDADPESPRVNTQELIAGDDVMQWLRERFGEGQAGYEIFTGLLQGVRDPQAQARLLQEPYVGRLQTELNAYRTITTALSETEVKVSRYERARDGALAEGELAITAAAQVLYPNRVPYTRDSDRTSLTADLRGLKDIDARKHTVAKTVEFLGGLVVK